MAKRFRLRELEQERGDLFKLIPQAVNRHGNQADAARELGVSQAAISMWLKDNGFRQVVKWEREMTVLLDLEDMP